MPWSRAHARMTPDRPRGTVLAAASGPGAFGRRLAEDAARASAFLVAPPLAVFLAVVLTVLLGEGEEPDVSSPFVERLTGPFRLRPDLARRGDGAGVSSTGGSTSAVESDFSCFPRTV